MTDQERITALEERVTKLEKLADSVLVLNQPTKIDGDDIAESLIKTQEEMVGKRHYNPTKDIEKGVFNAVRLAMSDTSAKSQ